MRILGIMIRKMDSMIQKNLEVGWFPFGDYPKPMDDAYVQLDEELETRRWEINSLLYPLKGDKCPSVSICCIAGKNGSGKSTLLDVLFRIINNVAYRYLLNNETAHLEYAFGVNADLHFEVGGVPGVVRCKNEETHVFLGYTDDGKCKELDNADEEDYKLLSRLFYTISINYSMYAYNCQDYYPRDNHLSRMSKGINGKWLEHVFHKNDGYLTPLVLAPFRDRNGNIDVVREKKLALQRLASLILLFRVQGKQFIPGYDPSKLYWRYDDRYLRNAKDKLMEETGYGKAKLSSRINDFRNAWKEYFQQREIDIENLVCENVKDIGKVCLTYLSYKSFKICLTYPEFANIYVDKAGFRQSSAAEAVVLLAKRRDHISVKIHQCLHFVESQDFKRSNGTIQIRSFASHIHGVKTYDDMMVHLPPSFFYFDLEMTRAAEGIKIRSVSNAFPMTFPIQFGFANTFTLDSMSSGERQFLHSISYALYHIKNIESVQTGFNRIHYDHINLVLDEAELYYHPEYQRRYVQMLLESMSWCQFSKIESINIIIVTHSPFILSDMVQDNVLYLEDGSRKQVDGYTFGANYYDLLYNSFFFEKNAIGEVSTRVITDMIQHSDKYKQQKWLLDILADPMVRGHILNKLERDV